MKPIADARKAESYYAKSDGGYYLAGDELGRKWGGIGAEKLGLAGRPEPEQFKRLVHGLDPHTAGQLTAKLVEHRTPAWDVTASVPKGVTLAIEHGDSRVRDALWDANRRAMADLQAFATTRVRKGGAEDDRITSNLVWFSTEHAETRPVVDATLPEDHPWRMMPDPDRHIHNVIFNLTFDATEGEWKAVKYRPIMDLRKYFDRRFDHYLAGRLSELGYAIDTEWQHDGRGTRYFTWDISGIPEAVKVGCSRRTAEVDELEAAIVAERQGVDPAAPDRLSTISRDALGATSRLGKRDDVTLADCRAYWRSRIAEADAAAIAETIAHAERGEHARPEPGAAKAVAFALEHHGERESVFELHRLAVTAMERSMGQATPADIDAEIRRQGVIVRPIGGQLLATTPALQREERFLAGFAADGRGSVCPAGVPASLDRGNLNDGQWEAVRGLLGSSDRVNVVQGPAGSGKTALLATLDEGMRQAGAKITYLATTSDAADVLKRDGFAAETVQRFLVDASLQAKARGGRVVIDESSMLGHKDTVRLYELARTLDLKLIHVGDDRQHGSVPRGALLRLLKEFGGIREFRLGEIMRQRGAEYRAAATLLSQGKTLEGFDAIDGMGWVREIDDTTDRIRHIAADYVQAVAERKSVLAVSPTHAEAAGITAEIRSLLRDAGRLGSEDRMVARLVAVNATEAEKARPETYRAGDVLQFHRNAVGHTIGERLLVADPAAVPFDQAKAFSVYRPEGIALAEGDTLRFTGPVKSLDGKHRLTNGMVKAVAGFTPGGNIRLENGWVIAKDAGHLRHGYVETSFGAQGRTVDRAIVAASSGSLPAINAEMAYVSSTRARERMTFYTDDKAAVRQAIQAGTRKVLALDIAPKPPDAAEQMRRRKDRRRRLRFAERLRAAWESMKPAWERHHERQAGYGR